MHRFNSLKTSHLVMWSSPILLVVLVFTLTSSPNLRPTSVPTDVRIAPTTTSSISTPAPSTTTTASALPPVSRPSETTTPALVVNNYVAATPTTVPFSAARPARVELNGVLSGKLDASFDVVDVPLQGPSSWHLITTAATNETLTCAGQSSASSTSVTIGSHQSCQLEITAATVGTAIEWQLSQTS